MLVKFESTNNESDIRNKISEMLPMSMIPDRILFLSEMPITETGKPDRDALKYYINKLGENR